MNAHYDIILAGGCNPGWIHFIISITGWNRCGTHIKSKPWTVPPFPSQSELGVWRKLFLHPTLIPLRGVSQPDTSSIQLQNNEIAKGPLGCIISGGVWMVNNRRVLLGWRQNGFEFILKRFILFCSRKQYGLIVIVHEAVHNELNPGFRSSVRWTHELARQCSQLQLFAYFFLEAV